MVDWGLLLAWALILSLATVVLTTLWRWLLALLLWGPSTYAGVIVGWAMATATRDALLGSMAAAIAAALLHWLTRVALALARHALGAVSFGSSR